MNLEDLISKYLDGELTQQEDETLRMMISRDDYAREKFYAAVSLHLEVSHDAETIETPKDLLEDTEDKVLMRILGDAPPAAAAETESSGFFRPALAMAASVAVFLILGVLTISDMQDVPFGNNFAGINTDNESAAAETVMNETVPSAETVPASADESISTGSNAAGSRLSEPAAVSIEAPASFAVMPEEIPDENPVLLAAVSDLPTDDELSVERNAAGAGSGFAAPNSDFSTSSALLSLNEASSDPINDSEISRSFESRISDKYRGTATMPQPELFSLSEFDGVNDNILVTSFYSNDFYHNGIDMTEGESVSHFSQSIAYSAGGNSWFGVEIGYTNFNYNHQLAISVPAGSKETTIEELTPDPTNNEYTTFYVDAERSKKMYWGSIFYESDIYTISDFTLLGRLGLGSSNDGPLGYGRFIAKYEFIDNFYLLFGSEGRMFKATMYNTSGKENSFKSTLSLIYGLQFKF